MIDRQKTAAVFALILVVGLIIWGGWLAWRAVGESSIQPVTGEEGLPGLTASSTPGALSTVKPDQSNEPAEPDIVPLLEHTPASGEATPLPEATKNSSSEMETPANMITATHAVSLPVTTEDRVAETSLPEETSPTVSVPTTSPTEGVVAPLSTPPGRLAPDVTTGPLQFQQIRIFSDAETGTFTGNVNVRNSGETFLNELIISWRILDEVNQILDQGQITWPNLAPMETATIPFQGSKTFEENWDRVEFDLLP